MSFQEMDNSEHVVPPIEL